MQGISAHLLKNGNFTFNRVSPSQSLGKVRFTLMLILKAATPGISIILGKLIFLIFTASLEEPLMNKNYKF